MPIPIMPINNRPTEEDALRAPTNAPEYQTIDVSVLQDVMLPKPRRSSMPPKLADSDAGLLFNLWDSAKSKQNEAIRVPQKFSNDDLLRLKALGLVAGDDESVRLTIRGREVIKNIVLHEENHLDGGRVSKPYTEILAEIEKSRRGQVRLAHGRE